MNTKLNIMVAGAVLMLTGAIISLGFNDGIGYFRGSHRPGAPQYIGAAFGSIGILVWAYGKKKQ